MLALFSQLQHKGPRQRGNNIPMLSLFCPPPAVTQFSSGGWNDDPFLHGEARVDTDRSAGGHTVNAFAGWGRLLGWEGHRDGGSCTRTRSLQSSPIAASLLFGPPTCPPLPLPPPPPVLLAPISRYTRAVAPPPPVPRLVHASA